MEASPAVVPKSRDGTPEKLPLHSGCCARPSFSFKKEKSVFLVCSALWCRTAELSAVESDATDRENKLVAILSHSGCILLASFFICASAYYTRLVITLSISNFGDAGANTFEWFVLRHNTGPL